MAKKNSKIVEAEPAAKLPELLKIGDRVLIRDFGGQRGEIVEYRGPLGPGHAHIYRVLVRRKPNRDYIELREDQLERIGSAG